MKTVLSFQNAIINGKDIFIIDGEKSEYSHSPAEEAAVKYLYPTKEMKKIILLKTKDASPSLKVYLDKERNVLITSHFVSTDEIGRRIIFSFYCVQYRNIEWLCSRLIDYAAIAGMEVNKEDIATIKKSLNAYSRRYLIIGGCILAIIILILGIK